jgi:RsiW-degrading membrane proteinase PrsW (M82 family)
VALELASATTELGDSLFFYGIIYFLASHLVLVWAFALRWKRWAWMWTAGLLLWGVVLIVLIVMCTYEIVPNQLGTLSTYPETCC